MFALPAHVICASPPIQKRYGIIRTPVLSPCRKVRAWASNVFNHQQHQLARRSTLHLLGVTSLMYSLDLGLSKSWADELEAVASAKTVYLDVSIDRKPAGRILIELFGDVPVGSQRFADLSVGIDGVGYRLSKFDSLRENYISNEGVPRLSYRDVGESPIAGGDSLEDLLVELNSGQHSNNSSGMVALVVKSVTEQQTKSRLVASGGKLMTVEDTLGTVPNGTAFTITTSPTPELDETNLVVGRVVEGMDVIRSLQALPTVRENKSSPFFIAAKTFGDKRADVAEKGFGKPFNRVMVSKGGLE